MSTRSTKVIGSRITCSIVSRWVDRRGPLHYLGADAIKAIGRTYAEEVTGALTKLCLARCPRLWPFPEVGKDEVLGQGVDGVLKGEEDLCGITLETRNSRSVSWNTSHLGASYQIWREEEDKTKRIQFIGFFFFFLGGGGRGGGGNFYCSTPPPPPNHVNRSLWANVQLNSIAPAIRNKRVSQSNTSDLVNVTNSITQL